jgi:diguanylate cyclase (GGDEF)-like protein
MRDEVFMFRRLAAVGAPPLLLILGTLLLVHYHARLLHTFWDGRLPDVWRLFLFYLPVMLAAVGVVLGIRLRSCGVLLVMLTLGAVLAMGRPFGDAVPEPFGGIHWLSQRGFLLMPVNYLLGLWTVRYAWQSRRGLWALAGAAGWAGVVAAGAAGGPAAAVIRPMTGWLPAVPAELEVLTTLGAGPLMAVIASACLAWHAVRAHDPIAAGLSASLVLLLPPFARDLNDISLAIVASAAVLVVLVGVLESMVALAYRDGLTGLPGRRGLNDKLRQLGRRYAIAMLDVDHFKRFNDRFGHRTGDDVLKMIAARMRQIPGGRAFRYGGEEFAVVFTGGAAPKAIDRMETFRASLARTPFVVRGVPRSTKKARGRKTGGMASRQRVKITVSVGVAVPGTGGRKAPEVLAAADKALYRAKKAGRNRVAA